MSPLTTTGRLVRPGGTEHPSLVDIAVSLSRQPRFAGHCRRWWSVLDHTLFCDELVKAGGDLIGPHLRLAVLLHDAHEAVTADVPTDCKDLAFKKMQGDLDLEIFGAYFPGAYENYRYGGYRDRVKMIDRRALCAEAQVVGPPVPPERTVLMFGSCDETPADVALLESLLHRSPWDGVFFGRAPREELEHQITHPQVQQFLRRMNELM